jgi:hypothetical protein
MKFLCMALKCAVSTHRITGFLFSKAAVNFYHCIWLILAPFVRVLTEQERMYSYFMQCNAVVHAGNFSRAVQG